MLFVVFLLYLVDRLSEYIFLCSCFIFLKNIINASPERRLYVNVKVASDPRLRALNPACLLSRRFHFIHVSSFIFLLV